MTEKLPVLVNKERICFICEGYEEYDYLQRIKDIGVINRKYEISLVNANGSGNIPARYQDLYQNGSFDLVLVFCDTERRPFMQYQDIKRKINELHAVAKAADEVVIFGNPCTLQIVLQHWDSVSLKSKAKKMNAPIIEKYTGVKNYSASDRQREQIYSQINRSNFEDMLTRIKQIPSDDTIVGSSNFGRFIENLVSPSTKWITKINAILESYKP